LRLDAAPLGDLAEGYAARPGAVDEMLDANGRVRPGWRRLLDGLGHFGPGELVRRWDKAQQLIHENGVSFNVYGDPAGMERPWVLSPVPVVLEADDWAQLTRGLAQRSRLLAALLRDLYGAQRTLMEGRLPPELVFGNPGFLRAVHNVALPGDDWLPLVGADLVRGPNGAFGVLEDRAQAPTGAGYALENRLVISSTIPELLRGCNVERLTLFFRALRHRLASLAPHNRDNPRIVLLTPGPYDATYFEQAYLAQFLGFTLVHGGDLTVRDDRVYLKTLGGLQPVDVILRRVNDDFCDPLELRPDSLIGVPGLVQAARLGNVAIANPLGTGVLQTPAIQPYLPALCKMLLGEELRLPSVQSWWCGEPGALDEVMARFDAIVLRPTFAEGPASPVFTATLSAATRDELRARVRARPAAWVAQEHVTPSTVPVLDSLGADAARGLVPRTLVLRCFAVSTQHDDYLVMPGGLARVAGADGGVEVTMQAGARSKDVWVLSTEASHAVAPVVAPKRAVELSRGGSDLPSRAADNLYWLGRYAERAEGIARLARVIAARLVDLDDAEGLASAHEFGPLFGALRAQTEFLYSADIPLDEPPSLETAEAQILAAVRDGACMGSLAAVVRSTLRAGRVVRDRISMDTWRVLAALDEEVARLDRADGAAALVDGLNRVVMTLAAFSGLAMESMTRGQSWRFVDIGRRLERAVSLVTLLRATTTRPPPDRDGPLLEAVLDIADSGMTYRRRYRASLQVAPVVDLLLTDDTNPRSALYQLRALSQHVRALPLLPGVGIRSPQLRLAVQAENELELADVEKLCAPDDNGTLVQLDELLRRLGTILPALSDSLSDSYLNHATQPRNLAVDESALALPAGGARKP
jgi:uncharacterized circularly permuted ATP-grasp superfamily protein/uncharacterized alpha-E superfamily protein